MEKTLQEKIEVMQAYADGKEIQFKHKEYGDWEDIAYPLWSWANCDYCIKQEPEIDWSRVKVDTPILVRNSDLKDWEKRHFSCYKNGKIYAFAGGETSWTSGSGLFSYSFGTRSCAWKYAKLPDNVNPEDVYRKDV